MSNRSKHRINPKSLANLKHEKGFTGNPGGLPKGLAAMVREMTKDGQELVKLNLEIMRGKLTVTKFDSDGNSYEIGPSIQDRQRAIEYLTERGFGKAIEVSMDVSAGDEQKELARQIARELAANPPLSSPSPEIKTP
jgi:hypothetical protein